MTGTPQSRLDSGELTNKVGTRLWKIVATIAATIFALTPGIIYVGRLPTQYQMDQAINKAIKTHAKHPHDGVEREIRKYAPSRLEFGELAGRVKVFGERWRRMERRMERIEDKLDTLLDGRAYKRRKRRRRRR